MSRPWWYAAFGHIVRALLILYKAEKQGRRLSISELARETGISSAAFYRTVKNALIEGGFVEIVPLQRERVIEVRLTDKGRRLAQCFEELGIEV